MGQTLRFTTMESPVGLLWLAGTETGLEQVRFGKGQGGGEEDERPFREAVRQLALYFAGKLRAFELELRPRGTEFQLAVWSELQRIPYGETVSYGELARRLGKPAASRAVGLANGANPIAIIIPCHRVIGATGKLTGFGGGLDVKRRLLALEQGMGLLMGVGK